MYLHYKICRAVFWGRQVMLAGPQAWPLEELSKQRPHCGCGKTEAHVSAFGSYTFPIWWSWGLPLRLPFGDSSLSAGGAWEVSLKWDGVGS